MMKTVIVIETRTKTIDPSLHLLIYQTVYYIKEVVKGMKYLEKTTNKISFFSKARDTM